MSQKNKNAAMNKWDKLNIVKNLKAFEYANQQLKYEQRIAAVRNEMESREKEIARQLINLKDSFKKVGDSIEDKKATKAFLAQAINSYKLLEKQLDGSLFALGISMIPALGAMVDDNLHFVERTVKMPDFDDGTVVDVVEEGFLLGKTIVRPARVIVVKN